LELKREKKNITTSKEGHVAITRVPLSFFLILLFIYLFIYFLSPTIFSLLFVGIVMLIAETTTAIANNLNFWLPSHQRWFAKRVVLW
jgi:hypothetical protein